LKAWLKYTTIIEFDNLSSAKLDFFLNLM
jgi:hypothetical protein